jgi:hypothetical protein
LTFIVYSDAHLEKTKEGKDRFLVLPGKSLSNITKFLCSLTIKVDGESDLIEDYKILDELQLPFNGIHLNKLKKIIMESIPKNYHQIEKYREIGKMKFY